MKTKFTTRQGQFLGFIHHYTTLHGRAPAEADMQQFFNLTPPSVHQMVPESTLEENLELMLSFLPDSRRQIWNRRHL